jgi:hypothetical protein
MIITASAEVVSPVGGVGHPIPVKEVRTEIEVDMHIQSVNGDKVQRVYLRARAHTNVSGSFSSGKKICRNVSGSFNPGKKMCRNLLKRIKEQRQINQ